MWGAWEPGRGSLIHGPSASSKPLSAQTPRQPRGAEPGAGREGAVGRWGSCTHILQPAPLPQDTAPRHRHLEARTPPCQGGQRAGHSLAAPPACLHPPAASRGSARPGKPLLQHSQPLPTPVPPPAHAGKAWAASSAVAVSPR